MSAGYQDDIDAIASIDAVPRILDMVCRTTGMRFAAVARVTEDRWITCQSLDRIAFGLKPGDELDVATTICHEVRCNGGAIAIDHVAESPAFRDHPTPAMYGFQSYISMPIVRADGRFFGTLCAIDPDPARLENPETIGMFRLYAELIAAHLDARERLALTQASLLDERRTAELREQFIAVLGHDLRNPVASIGAGVRRLQQSSLDQNARNVLTLMKGSVLRTTRLIDNLLGFARGRLGGGLAIERMEQSLAPPFMQVIDEVRSIFPAREIDSRLDLKTPFSGDVDALA